MAIALGAQAVNATPGTTSTTHTVALTFSAGDLVVVCVACRDNVAVSSVGDSVNGAASYTRAGAAQQDVGDGTIAELWYFQNSGAGAATVTVTFAATARAGVNGSRWTGAATSSALDQNSGNNNGPTVTAHTAGSITTTGAGLMIASYQTTASPGTRTFGTWTALTSNDAQSYDRSCYGYRIVTGATTDDAGMTSGNGSDSSGKIASFNEASAGDPEGSLIGGKLLRGGLLLHGVLVR